VSQLGIAIVVETILLVGILVVNLNLPSDRGHQLPAQRTEAYSRTGPPAVGQVINKLREAGVLSDATYYKWRKEYGGLRVDQAKRMKELEQENNRLRKVVSDLSIDNAIRKEAMHAKVPKRQPNLEL
jgi:hypothetical protein